MRKSAIKWYNAPRQTNNIREISKGGIEVKATGIVRRIDDLGRVVIPKEIRRTLRIREGDPLEIYTDNDGEVIFKKYSPMGEMSHFAEQYAEVLARISGFPTLITDRDRVIAASGLPKKDCVDRRLSEELSGELEQRRTYAPGVSHSPISAAEGVERPVAAAVPIIAAGDLAGAVVLLASDQPAAPGEAEMKLISAAANFLAKQLDE
jgi:AbrB family transcriptional regulator (stage V sporulation protein T)